MDDPRDQAMLDLLGWLRDLGYHFVPPTPATHARVIARRDAARDLRDALGWSLPFPPGAIPDEIVGLLERADALEPAGGNLRKVTLRVATLDGMLFLHSAYPTDAADSVFFGPDSYRFVRFLRSEVGVVKGRPKQIVDIGCGSGVGGIATARLLGRARALLLDVNPSALRLAAINARHNGIAAETRETSVLDGVDGPLDLVVANPPFLRDPAHRAYRDGGGMLGAELSLDWALAATDKLAPGGRMLLYTASAIVGGGDGLFQALRDRLPASISMRYTELDPDIFGEELERPDYAEVERIAAVGVVLERPR